MPTIKLYANLRKLAGAKEVAIRGRSVGEIVSELVKRNPSLEGTILAEGEIRPHVIILINGLNATELDAPVNDDDVIAIFPPIAGG
jgi:molybdopterin synthase sulfur carrier subunit